MSVVFRETRLLDKKSLNTLWKKPSILNKNLIVNLLILNLNPNIFTENRSINIAQGDRQESSEAESGIPRSHFLPQEIQKLTQLR